MDEGDWFGGWQQGHDGRLEKVRDSFQFGPGIFMCLTSLEPSGQQVIRRNYDRAKVQSATLIANDGSITRLL
jgi:6-phosphogluconolactonase (cycloisomerase 2 family)